MLLMLCLCLGHVQIAYSPLIWSTITFSNSISKLIFTCTIQRKCKNKWRSVQNLTLILRSSVIKPLHTHIYSTMLLMRDRRISCTHTIMIYNSEIIRCTSLKSCSLYINCIQIYGLYLEDNKRLQYRYYI